jgi:hypothetical protein
LITATKIADALSDLSLLAIFGWLAAVASIVGLVYTVLAWKRERTREKRLAFEVRGGPPLARSRNLGDFELRLIFSADGGKTDEAIGAAYVTYGLLANLGREPIRRGDIAPANPLRIEVDGARVLTIEVERATRSVCQISLGTASASGNTTAAPLTFDFLDGADGALIRILSDGRPSDVRLVGDVIGMPSGIYTAPDNPEQGKLITTLQVVLYTALFAGPQAAIAYWFVQATQRPLILLWLPIALLALIAAGLIAAVLSNFVNPSARPLKFPAAIASFKFRHTHRGGGIHRDTWLMDDLLEEELNARAVVTRTEQKGEAPPK